eukprot:CAMPEP_0116151450 /NCGR_PEP_ID=MMETSP0329-20121206/20101_1 /TAXON_ID=697910 /ORGANISM="Pseudo-nitzschia arenysensis, Strain B593" /LENGTH=333 /DNA_ID=CAMNT_0003648059 /DNA_START=192 /DNA_END=1193 /DNA_ORIENTATION=+
MMNFSGFQRRGVLYHLLVSFVLYTWTVLAFPGRLHTTATSARGFVPPLPSAAKAIARRFGNKAFTHHATVDKTAEETSFLLLSQQDEIEEFLASKGGNSPTSLLRQFHVQGWRWHTKSLARDAGRLHKLALKSNLETAETLKDASDYVVGFNMVGLHRVEGNLFFPWMREKLVHGSKNKPVLSKGFSSAMDALESDRRSVADLGSTISKKALLACDTQASDSSRNEAIAEVANDSAELQCLVERMISIEDKILVPAIGAMVKEREQKSFNNRVLRKLGLLDSRLHLVGMYETVWEDNDSLEKELFKKAIPGFTQQLIPRWRRKLYQPRTSMME